MKKLIYLFITIFLLIACKTSTQKQYFKIDYPQNNQIQQHSKITQRTIYLKPLELSEALTVPNILFQIDQHRFTYTQQNLWLIPLQQQLFNYTKQYLTHQLNSYVVTSSNQRHQVQVGLELFNFNARYDGKAILTGNWLLQIGQQKPQKISFHYEIAQTKDGYQALVKALQQGFEQALTELTSHLK